MKDRKRSEYDTNRLKQFVVGDWIKSIYAKDSGGMIIDSLNDVCMNCHYVLRPKATNRVYEETVRGWYIFKRVSDCPICSPQSSTVFGDVNFCHKCGRWLGATEYKKYVEIKRIYKQ